MGKLEGKTAIITGGASGIGRAAVELFAAEGASVLIADVQDDAGAALCRTLGDRVAYRHVDVTVESEVQAAVNYCVSHFGRLDCMYNNAGVAGGGGPIEQIPESEFSRLTDVLLRGVFFGMKCSAPVMKQQGSGVILSTASVAGLRAGFSSHIYSAAKAAVIHLTRSVAMELGEAGIRVNCVCPGAVPTPIFAAAFGTPQAAAQESIPRVEALFAKLQPLPRACTPNDIARAALWLASDDAGFVNGHALTVDGGLTGGNGWSSLMAIEQQLWSALDPSARAGTVEPAP